VLQAPELGRTVKQATLATCLTDIGRAMRRPGLLQRADELVPHSVGHVLQAIALAVRRSIDGFQSVSCSAYVTHLKCVAG
jgi:hypothetical protein